MPTGPRISTTMALDAIEEAQRAVDEAKAHWEKCIEERDCLIRDARAAKVPEKTIMGRTGLSRDSIGRIAASKPKGVSES